MRPEPTYRPDPNAVRPLHLADLTERYGARATFTRCGLALAGATQPVETTGALEDVTCPYCAASASAEAFLAELLVRRGADRRAAARAKDGWTLLGSIAAVRRFARVLAGHTGDGYGGLDELAATAQVAAELRSAIDDMARRLAADGASYRELGEALGITAQAAQLRYPGATSRRPGGQPSHLR